MDKDARIEDLEAEVKRLSAIVEGKLSDTRLLRAGPGDNGKFEFELADGPIPYIAEYLAQFLDSGKGEGLSNYAEMSVSHHKHGELYLTLQRKRGKTPHELRAEAEARVRELERRLAAVYEAIR